MLDKNLGNKKTIGISLDSRLRGNDKRKEKKKNKKNKKKNWIPAFAGKTKKQKQKEKEEQTKTGFPLSRE